MGAMDPTIGYGQIFTLSGADLRALDLIGYDISPVPEPVGAFTAVWIVFAMMRRRKAV